MEKGGISSQLPDSSTLQCPPSHDQSQSMVQRRPHTPTVSISSQSEAYPGWLQDKPVRRLLHLAAQPGVEVPGSQPRDQEDSHKGPTSSAQAYAGNNVHQCRCKAKHRPARKSARLKATGGSKPTAKFPS